MWTRQFTALLKDLTKWFKREDRQWRKQMRWEKDDLPSLVLNWKRRKRETVGRTRNKEMIDKVFKSLSIL